MSQRKRRRGRHARSRNNGTSNANLGHRGLSGQGARALRMEQLEDRRMLATYVVNDLGDLTLGGNVIVGTLRQAVNLANANPGFDTISFGDFLFNNGPGTIFLDGGPNGEMLELTDVAGVEIIGPGPGVLSIYAAGDQRVFLVDDGNPSVSSPVRIQGLALSNGDPNGDDLNGRGGAILNNESLTLEEVEIRNSMAPGGGGAIFNQAGFVLIERSLIRSNTSALGGGGIQNGIEGQTTNLPTTTIINSTITGNTAIGVPVDDLPTGYGGGVLNLAGSVNIEQSTITGNIANVDGGGVGSQGFDPGSEEMPASSGPATTNIRSSIIVGNTTSGAPSDVGSVGMTIASNEEPPVPFEPQINSQGYNLFGAITHNPTSLNPGITLPPHGPGDVISIGTNSVFTNAGLSDFGGVLPVFMPDINKVGGMQAIDGGAPLNIRGNYDQRGSQFVRAFDAFGGAPRMDIGAAEVQLGNFSVNTLADDFDGRYRDVPVEVGTFPFNALSFVPDFSLREALDFARKNLPSLAGAEFSPFTGLQGENLVVFSDSLLNEVDPTPATSAPTIVLTLGELVVDFPAIIQGPTFELEIDATGNDATPNNDIGDGSRVFSVTDTVEIRNLVLRGGDRKEFGGAILTSGDLTLTNSTLLDNATPGNGGALYVASGVALVEGTTINNNTASGDGGGIYVAAGNVTISNSTISGNTGSRGGGIANANGNLLIQYSTITLNLATSLKGSGIASFRDASAVTSIRSSIIAGNTVTDVQHIKPGTDSFVSLGYNLVGTGNAVIAAIFSAVGDLSNVLDPMLGPLTRLGGPTPTHRLLPGSPAVNAGDPNAAGLGNVPSTDQRGFPFDRIELDGIDQIDIGAYEVQNGVLFVGDGSPAEGSFTTFAAALTESNLTPTKEVIVFLPTWAGEFFPGGNLAITDSVDIFGGGNGFSFFGLPTLDILIDDGNNASLLDVSIDSLRFENNTRVDSRENLTFSNMQFVNNTAAGNGGAISQQFGKLTISDSTFIGNSTNGTGNSGGAISVVNGDLEISNSLLTGNSAIAPGGKGGAIYINNGNFTSTGYLYVTGNTASAATGAGGGIYGLDSTIMLTNAIISGNSTTGSDSNGGGLAAKNTDITLIDSAITFNTTNSSQSRGGGIFLEGGSLDIRNGNLFANKTYGPFSSGGGISSLNAEVTITGTSVNRNEVFGNASDGGGIDTIGGNLTVRDSAIIFNKTTAAGSRGGGIFSNGDLSTTQTTTIINSTISGNSTPGTGGGLFNAGGLTTIEHSTITANEAPYVGSAAGVGSYGNSSTTLTQVSSSIIAGNLANLANQNFGAADFNDDNTTNGADFLSWQSGFGKTVGAQKSEGDADGDNDVDSNDLQIWESGFGSSLVSSDVDRVGGAFNETFQSLGYNLIGDGLSTAAFTSVGDQTGADPLLGSLASNGGLTQTHALLVGSPAANAGDPAFDSTSVTPSLDFDQRGTGFSREVGGRIDIGAYESDILAGLAADFNTDGNVNGQDFLAWQIGFGLTANAQKSDGNADNDSDVDYDDLGVWEATLGETGPPAVLVASSAASPPEPLASQAAPTAVPHTSSITATNASKTEAPLAVQAPNSETAIPESPAPALAASFQQASLSQTSPTEVGTEELRDAVIQMTRINSKGTTSTPSHAPRPIFVSSVAFIDSQEVAARDTSLSRFALPAIGQGTLSEDLDLGDLAASRHREADSRAGSTIEDLVFQLFGEEEL